MACLFGHKWNGCKCSKCNTQRDEQHEWSGCQCAKCGAINDVGHVWKENSCECIQCGVMRHVGIQSDENTIIVTCKYCGAKVMSTTFFKDNEIALLLKSIPFMKFVAKKAENKSVDKLIGTVTNLLINAKSTNEGWFTLEELTFIRTSYINAMQATGEKGKAFISTDDIEKGGGMELGSKMLLISLLPYWKD